MTKKQFRDLTIHLYNAGSELSEIETAVHDIERATGDKDWLKHVSEIVGAIEITRQIILNIYLN